MARRHCAQEKRPRKCRLLSTVLATAMGTTAGAAIGVGLAATTAAPEPRMSYRVPELVTTPPDAQRTAAPTGSYPYGRQLDRTLVPHDKENETWQDNVE
ncbi:hypothetical protein [Wenjunlia tyrosinilytica]|uniref:Uncharacterized protein n=1 Tax=Wenjunlia tyrosinilytica TaxID=1544741 RepID=A0A917ZZX5_9ACTN|nr:hypothetical protein [Wenjunlia tyrosinilytica]GGP00603.1 hypothetical protein GCM10012280_69720 [Wenjunlia tyrosinilytica]